MKRIQDFGSFSKNNTGRVDEKLLNFWDNNISESFGSFSKAGEISKIQKEYIASTSNKGGNPKELENTAAKILEACGGNPSSYFDFVGSNGDDSVGIGIPGIPQLEVFGEIYGTHGMLPSVLNSQGVENIIETTKNMFLTLEDVLENEKEITASDDFLKISKETIDRIRESVKSQDAILSSLNEYLHIVESIQSDDFEMLSESEKSKAVDCFEKFTDSPKRASDLKQTSPKFFKDCSGRSGGSSEDIAALGDLGF